MSSGSPPTLWCDLMVALSTPPDSTMSGYSVPCTRKRASSTSRADLLEHADERLADDLALALGVGDVVERAEEPVGRLHVDQVDVELAAERLLDLLGLALAQQTGVDEHARELVADRLVHERGGDRRVDAAGETADHPLAADLRPDLGDRLLDDRGVRPRRPAAAHVVQERLEHLLAALGVHDLGMELHAVDGAVAVLERGDRGAGRRRRDAEAGGRGRDRVAVAHPHVLLVGQLAEQQGRVSGADGAPCAPYSPPPVVAHLAAQLLGDQLRAVADAEDRHAGVVDPASIDGAPSTCTDAGPPERMIPFGRLASISASGIVRGTISRVDVRLAHAPGDQLRVLRPEVDDEDGVDWGASTRHLSTHADALAALEGLALGLQRRGDHHLGLLELLDVS